jgi:PKD repeat protein
MIEITHSSAVEDTIRCLADFNYYMSVEGLKVNFTNTSQGHTTSFYWDFGNGLQSAVLNPEVIFEQDG